MDTDDVAELILGPLLRHVGEHDATVWVETNAPCEVEVLGHRAPTFDVEGHHYALVVIDGLEAGEHHPYEVALDGRRAWPELGTPFPPSHIRTIDSERPASVVFGSCRVTAPQVPPFTLSKDADDRGRGIDALRTLALRLKDRPVDELPDALLLLGDQIYADEVSPQALEFVRASRDTENPPGEEVADFEEYTRLYWEAWRDGPIRWLLSTVPTAMIFDDHDVHDDWNTSAAWVERMRAKPWWEERIVGAFMSYWLYQHLGNLSPRELAGDDLFQRVRELSDAAPALREFARKVDRGHEGTRWSYCRDLGRTRLVVLDSRAGRVLGPERRTMVDEHEWAWIEEQVAGDFDHLLLATTLPLLLAPGMHHLEAWNEAVCAGAWGKTAARAGEWLRETLDLEHWAAFGESFARVAALLEYVGAGRRGSAPASIVVLSGDVHHAYVAEVAFRRGAGVQSAVYQATCSPVRNPLDVRERRLMRAATSRTAAVVAGALARAAGVAKPSIRWRFSGEPSFENQIATLDLDGRTAMLRIERPVGEGDREPHFECVLERALSDGPQGARVPARAAGDVTQTTRA